MKPIILKLRIRDLDLRLIYILEVSPFKRTGKVYNKLDGHP